MVFDDLWLFYTQKYDINETHTSNLLEFTHDRQLICVDTEIPETLTHPY